MKPKVGAIHEITSYEILKYSRGIILAALQVGLCTRRIARPLFLPKFKYVISTSNDKYCMGLKK